MSYDLREKVNYVGWIGPNIDATNRLPTTKQVLAVFFYYYKKKKSSEESARLAIIECLPFWKNAGITTQEEHKCVAKLIKEFTRWKNLSKSSSRKTENQIKNENIYRESINRLFDISSGNAHLMPKNESSEEIIQPQTSN